MNRRLLSKRSICFAIALVMLFSVFCGTLPAAAETAGLYQISDLNAYGGFEVDTDNNGLANQWFFESWATGYTAEVVGTDPHGGEKCQKLTAIAQPVASMNFDWVAVSDAKEYRIKFWAKIPQGTLTLSIHELNSSWGPIGESGNPRMDIPSADNGDIWKEYTYIYIPRDGAVNIGVRFSNWSGTIMTAYIDDVSMEECITLPVITPDQPDVNEVTDQETFTVSGTVADAGNNLRGVTVNGVAAVVNNTAFSAAVPLIKGANIITVAAEDSKGNTASKAITVILYLTDDPGDPPVITLDQSDAAVIGLDNKSFTVSGSVYDADGDFLSLKVNGIDVSPDGDGNFTAEVVLKIGPNTISVAAADVRGNTAEKNISVVLKLEKEKQPYDIGAFYFSNWNPELSPHMVVNTQKTYGRDNDWFGGVRDMLLGPGLWGYGPIADREPMLGWYDDRQQKVLDAHILEAASRGIDHFAFYYYWRENGTEPRPGQNVELWKTSPYRDMMDYYIYYVADGAYNAADWRQKIVPKLVEFMKEPYYKRSKSDDPAMNDRPIMGFFGDMISRMGGTNARLKAELDYLRDKAVEAGVGNPIFLYDGYRTLSNFIAQGYDGFLPLNLAGIGLDDNIGVPEDYASAYPGAWNDFVYKEYTNNYENYENYLFIPGGLNAYDVRPWKGVANPSLNYMYADPSPLKFKEQLNNVKDYLDSHPGSMNMATFYAWNEWGEGGSIEPDTLFGYGYVDAMQEVFGLKNTNYTQTAEDNGLTNLAPETRLDVESEWSVVTMGQEVVLKTRVKNYSTSQAAGTLTLSQPAKNAEGMDQPLWTVKSDSAVSFNLAPGEAMDIRFVVAVGGGEDWARHNFIITDGTQNISTFVVKAAPFYALLEKDESKIYNESKFDLLLTARNYTMEEKTVNYTLKLPRRWTADKPAGVWNMSGYSGTGVHANRTVNDRVVISCPADTQVGDYTIKLVTSDGEFAKEDSFTVHVGELVYNGGMVVNGDFETDTDEDGKPDGWILIKPGNVSAAISLEKSPALAYNGSGASLGFTSPQDTNDSGVYATEEQFHAVNPEKTYTIDFFARVPTTGVIHLFVEEKASAEAPGVRKDMSVDAHQWAHQQWTKFTKDYIPTPGTQFARVVFYNWNPNPLEGYIDNVSFKLKPSLLGPAPVITPDQGDGETDKQSIVISGTVLDDNGDLTEITINGAAVGADEEGRFSKTVTLQEGENTILTVAKDAAGNETARTLKITYVKPDEGTPPDNYPSGPPAASKQQKEPEITKTGGVNVINNEVKDGKTAADLSDKKPEDIFAGAVTDRNRTDAVRYKFNNTENADEYSLKLPAAALNDGTAEKKLIIDTGLGTVELPSNMLIGTGIEAAGVFEISISKADTSKLDENVRAKLHNRPVIELKVKIDGKSVNWENKNSEVRVCIPYTPGPDEEAGPGNILMYFIDASGSLIPVSSSMYDPGAGCVSFATSHFSRYAVGYGNRTFSDLDNYPWARKEIEALASRNITGNAEELFRPSAAATRGQFIKLVVDAFGLDAEVDGNFSDVQPADDFYRQAGIAKKLGLVYGTGNNRISPEASISRQDMVVILSRLLELRGRYLEKADAGILDRFTDKSLVAAYARDSMASFIKNGIIQGTGKNADPKRNTTRAEMAVILYRVLKLYING